MAGMAYIKWFGADWRSDPKLRLCSAESRGVWADMLSLMMEAEPYGHLLIDGKKPTAAEIGLLTCTPAKVVERSICQLGERGVYSVTECGVIYSRRLLRDKARSEQGRAFGKEGGNPSLKRQAITVGVNPPPYPDPGIPLSTTTTSIQKEPDANASVERKATHGQRGTRLAADCEPTAEDRAFAEGLGLDATEHWLRYRDYWTAKPGKDGRKADWPATWRNWCRREADKLGGIAGVNGAGRAGANRPSPGGIVAAANRILSRLPDESG